MQITFKSAKLKKIFEHQSLLRKEYGEKCAGKIMLRISILASAENLDCVPKLKPDRCHSLKGDRKGQFAVDLLHPFRLVFVPDQEEITELETGALDLKKVICIKILKVEDYH